MRVLDSRFAALGLRGAGPARVIAAALSTCFVAPATSAAQDLVFEIEGTEAGAQYGRMVSCVGDVDGNGLDDFLVGEPFSSAAGPDSGRAVLVSGRTAEPIFTLVGQGAGHRYGYGVAGAGLVDGDETPDFIVGAPLENARGAAVVYAGKDGAELLRFRGSPGSLFGAFVDGAGDVNGDQHDDVVVSAPAEGSVRVFSGADGALLHTFTGLVGTSFNGVRLEVHGARDIDQDGFDDILIGEPFYANGIGRALVFCGESGTLLRSWSGEGPNSALFGYSVDALGDTNGDGHPEILIGIPHRIYVPYTPGEARVYSGKDSELLWSLRAPHRSRSLGRAISNAGDVNGDAVDDFLLGAPYVDDGVGQATLVSGRSGLVLHEFRGQAAHGMPGFGYALSGGGDVDGDGLADVLIGAPHGATDRGVVRVFAGNDLFLRLDPEERVAAGGTLELTTTGGMDGAASRLSLVSIDGVPVRRTIDSGRLGPGGERSYVLPIPPNARGLELGFRATAQHGSQDVDSRIETVRVR